MVDLETDGVNPDEASPIQISALAIDPINLKIIPSTEFNSFCKPDNFDNEDYLTKDRLSTYEFHAKCKNMSVEEVIESVRNSPPIKLVFENFVEYTRQYHDRENSKSLFTAPIFAGFNSLGFDEVIVKRLCQKYRYVDSKDKRPNIFYWRDSIDIMKLVWPWMENSQDAPKNFQMDTLRKMFNINVSLAGAHDGLQDCKDQAELMIRLLKLNRAFYSKVQWPWLSSKT